jgi:hypothetical protein
MKITKVNFVKKLVLILMSSLLVLSSSFLVPAIAMAEEAPSTWYNQDFKGWFVKVYDDENPSEIFGERYTAAQVQWILFSLVSIPIMAQDDLTKDAITCALSNDIVTCAEALSGAIKNITDNILPTITADVSGKSPLAQIFDRRGDDISGISYVQNKISSFSIIPEAKAQGFGYDAVSWVQKYWSGFRNIAYALTVFVVIIFAFMIMFRVKLSPQLVISVQSALPKVFIALILATFSYAIAGFMIDLMYVVSGLFASLLNVAGFSSSFSGAYAFISGTGWVFKVVGVFTIFFMMIGYSIVFLLSALWAGVASILSLSVMNTLLSILLMIAVLVLLLVTIWYAIKIPWVLIKTLISIYVGIITAPIQIIAGAIFPSAGFLPWIKRLAGDLLVFPVVGVLFWFAWATLWSSFTGSAQVAVEGLIPQSWGWQPFPGNTWVPPILSSGGEMTGLIFLMMSFSIIIAIPKIATNIKGLFMGEKITWGTAIGEAIGPIGTGYGSYAAAQFGAGALPWPLGRIPVVRDFINKHAPKTENKQVIGRTIEGVMRAEK